MADGLTKLFISFMVGAGDAGMRLLRGPRMPGSCVTINYHSISTENRVRFGHQLDLLLRLTQPIPAARQRPLEKGARCVAITVDDLFCSFIENGLPELLARKIPVTVFVPTGYLGRKSAWEDYGGENRVGEEVASADELKRISAFDTVDFGSHCVTHPDLARLSEGEARRELRDSKDALEKIVGRKVGALSFPYGSHSVRDLKLAGEAGYQFCFDSTPQSAFHALRGGLTGRVSVQPTDSDLEFKLKVLGAYRWVRQVSAWKRKAIKPVDNATQTAVVGAGTR
jgi:peptidoglycan/xylan/chitin deacetylase (PgdA/CDA1 family)